MGLGSLLAAKLTSRVATLSVGADLVPRPADLEGQKAGAWLSEVTGILLLATDVSLSTAAPLRVILSAELGLLLQLVETGGFGVEMSCKVAALALRDEEELLPAVAGLRLRLSGRGFFDEGKLWPGFALFSLSLLRIGGRSEMDFLFELAS
jgi:hypothetical protein